MVTDAVTCRWHYSVGVAQALQPYGIDVHFAVIGPRIRDSQRGELAALGNVTLTNVADAEEWTPWDGAAYRGGEWLLALEERLAPDAVHLNHPSLAALPWSRPTLLTVHGDALSRARACGETLADTQRSLEELLAGLRAADQVIAPSQAALHDLCAHYRPGTVRGGESAWEPFRAEPRVIPHTRCRYRFAHRPKREFVLAAGRLSDAGKNLAALDDAARDLPWPVFIAGSVGAGQEAEFIAADCLGPLTPHDLANWMGLAAIFVLPSRYEASGLTALEAALCGCALVLADLPNLREAWCDAALFVDPTRPVEIGNALQKLVRNPELRARLGHLARKRALRHSPEQMAERLLECYGEVLTRRGSTTPAR